MRINIFIHLCGTDVDWYNHQCTRNLPSPQTPEDEQIFDSAEECCFEMLSWIPFEECNHDMQASRTGDMQMGRSVGLETRMGSSEVHSAAGSSAVSSAAARTNALDIAEAATSEYMLQHATRINQIFEVPHYPCIHVATVIIIFCLMH